MERREFIGTGTAAGVAMMGAAVAQEAGNVKEVKVAIIGCGTQGRVLMNSMLKIPGLKFVAICDIWSYSQRYVARYLMKYGHEVTVYEDYKELLKEADVDACVIATPDVWHAPVTVACLEAGKQVYCEKNMSNTIEGARQMVKAMTKTGNLLQIGHQRRSNPRYLHVKEKLIDDKNIFGRLMFSNAQWNRGVSEPDTWPSKYEMTAEELAKWGYSSMLEFRNWRWFRKHGGGPICDLGAHQIDIFNWFFGSNPVSVMASGGKDYYTDYEWEDNAMAIYEYMTDQGMARAFYQVLTTTSSLGFLERFMGTEATLAISENPRWNQVYREVTAEPWDDYKKNGLLLKEGDEDETEGDEPKVDIRMSPAPEKWELPVVVEKPLHMPHLENFFAAVRGEGTLNCPADVAFPTAVTVLKVNEAVEKKQRLELTPEDFVV